MKAMRLALALVVCLSSLAGAQSPEPEQPSPPPVVAAEEQPAIPATVVPANAPLPAEPPGQDVSYLRRCFAVPGEVWIPMPSGRYSSVAATSSAPLSNFHSATPVGSSGSGSGSSGASGSGSSGGSSGGGLGDGKAILVLAVVVIAALPVVVYALDEDAPAVVEQRFHCPTFGFDVVGGADFGGFGVAGAGSGRVNFGYAYFGSDFQFDLTTGSVNSYAGHLLLRIAPKAHIQPNIAFGFRVLGFQGRQRAGLELGVPHRYVFWRSGLREFGLELRPTFMFGFGTFDVGLEAALVVPLVEPLHLRVGGRVQSFGDDVVGGVNAGLSFSL